MENSIPNCKNFTGYKPCFSDHNCWENGCKENVPHGIKILIINLDAMGDVLMTTARLPSLKRKYPDSTIYWMTLKNSAGLLDNNPYLDEVLIYNMDSILFVQNIKFDLVLNTDKSILAGSILNKVNATRKLGFGINEHAKIIPLNKGAGYNYRLGMDDNFKFRMNQRTKQDYVAETFEIDFVNDEYVFNFSKDELTYTEKFKKEIGINDGDEIIGFNTGCSELYPNKKMTIDQIEMLIERFLDHERFKILLLGGPQDTERNSYLSKQFRDEIIDTPTTYGIRNGACYMSIPQLVITGDSFGMHMAIALKKYIIAWFGLSCWTEIDLYGRGIKLIPEGLYCAPCWKKQCPHNLECIQMIDLDRIEKETVAYFDRLKKHE